MTENPPRPRPDVPNPERRSDAALICFCAGIALVAVSWFFGVGGVLAGAATGSAPIAAAGAISGVVVLLLGAAAGGLLTLIGVVWLIVRVIADQRESDKYSREVER